MTDNDGNVLQTNYTEMPTGTTLVVVTVPIYSGNELPALNNDDDYYMLEVQPIAYANTTYNDVWYDYLDITIERTEEEVFYAADIQSSQDYYPFGSYALAGALVAMSIGSGLTVRRKMTRLRG